MCLNQFIASYAGLSHRVREGFLYIACTRWPKQDDVYGSGVKLADANQARPDRVLQHSFRWLMRPRKGCDSSDKDIYPVYVLKCVFMDTVQSPGVNQSVVVNDAGARRNGFHQARRNRALGTLN